LVDRSRHARSRCHKALFNGGEVSALPFLRKPALDLSGVVRQQCTLITGALQWTVAGFARPRRAVKPNAAWRRAEGAGYALSS
jgi:hypothetical protein